ncbi:MAG: hypothetical protein KDC27_02385, partial [Acidobacteria bacterium]|nr:hypothetical protein [Acidobacteriota bacterium]
AITPGQWTYVTVSFDAVNRKGSLYLDGTLDRTAVFAGYTPANGSEWSLAGASWTNGYFLPVTLDRTRLWAEELSREQIVESMAE